MISRWKIFLRLSAFHEYRADGRCSDVEWIPDTETRRKLSGLGMVCKVFNGDLLVLAKVDDGGRLTVSVPSDARFRFRMVCGRGGFLSTTSIDENRLGGRFFVFDNLGGAALLDAFAAGGQLPRPPQAYAAARKYRSGDLVRTGGATYECLSTSLGIDPSTPGTQLWTRKALGQYGSSDDLLPTRGMFSRFALSVPAKIVKVRVSAFEPATRACTKLCKELLLEAPTDPFEEIAVDLTDLPTGRYRVEANGDAFDSWHGDDLSGDLGVLEVYAGVAAPDPLALLDATHVVREATYGVRFGTRQAYWKYLTPLNKVTDIRFRADHALASPFDPGSFDPAFPTRKDYFVSKTPLPISEDPAAGLFDLILGAESRTAPRADPTRPGAYQRTYDSVEMTYTDTTCVVRLHL